MQSLTDIQLIEKIRVGDYIAFRFLFERYYIPLCNYASGFFKNDFLKEDVVQEIFTKIWEDRKKIQIAESVKSYLYMSVRNKSLNRIKSESIRQEYTGNFFRNAETQISEAELEQEEFKNYLFRCIGKLPPRCKDVFEKSRFEEMKQEKIADSLGISLKTVKAQIGKALRLIRECLQFSYPEFL